MMQSFNVFFDLHLNKRLIKQSRRWWFEMLSCSLWRHCNVWDLSERLSYWELIENISRKFTYNGQWCRASMFSLIYTWTNGWLNNQDAGDLRCYHAHYDVTVMYGTWVRDWAIGSWLRTSRENSHIMASDAELQCFLWSTPEQTVD